MKNRLTKENKKEYGMQKKVTWRKDSKQKTTKNEEQPTEREEIEGENGGWKKGKRENKGRDTPMIFSATYCSKSDKLCKEFWKCG